MPPSFSSNHENDFPRSSTLCRLILDNEFFVLEIHSSTVTYRLFVPGGKNNIVCNLFEVQPDEKNRCIPHSHRTQSAISRLRSKQLALQKLIEDERRERNIAILTRSSIYIDFVVHSSQINESLRTTANSAGGRQQLEQKMLFFIRVNLFWFSSFS